MDMGIIDCLVMTLFSAVVCICLPRTLTLIGSNLSISKLNSVSLKSSISDSPQSTDYPELTTVNS